MQGLERLPAEIAGRLTRELAGERILWAGQPSPSAAFWSGAGLLIFAVPWLAFALVWEGLALGAFFNTGFGKVEGPGGWLSFVFPIFGVPFVLIGVGMVVSPAWKARTARRTVHALTDRRLVTVEFRGERLSVESFDPRRLTAIKRIDGKGDAGTIELLLGMSRDSDGDPTEKREKWLGVPQVKALETALRGMMAGRG